VLRGHTDRAIFPQNVRSRRVSQRAARFDGQMKSRLTWDRCCGHSRRHKRNIRSSTGFSCFDQFMIVIACGSPISRRRIGYHLTMGIALS